MRNIDNNFMKLFMLAAHLQSPEIQQKYPRNKFLYFVHNGIVLFNEDDGVHFNFLYPFLIKEMPVLFTEWNVIKGKIAYQPAPDLPDTTAFCEFMGLESEEFIDVFIPCQTSEKEPKSLCPEAKPAELAERIFAFLEFALAQRTGANKTIMSHN